MKLINKIFVIEKNMCTHKQKKLCGKKECKICYERSFASYEGLTKGGKKKVDCWDYEKNELTPLLVSKGTHKKYWFICDICEHEFENVLKDIASLKKPCWCPYCSIPTKKICFSPDCDHCYKKSFQSYKGKTSKGKLKIECWSKKNIISSREVLKGNDKKFWFICDVCEHEFDTSLDKITGKRGRWCPYCCIPIKKLCGRKDCKFCYEKSFASYDALTKGDKKKVDCWDYKKNELEPITVSISSGIKHWFLCDICNHI